ARILHAIDIVDLGMGGIARREIVAVDTMDDVERHRLQIVEHCWLVHVVPEAGDAVIDKLAEVRPPPIARFCVSEVGEDRWPRPDLPHKNRAIRVMDEMVARNAAIIWRIALLRRICDMEIGDRDELDSFAAELARQCFEIRESLFVDGEWTVAV